MAGIARAGIDFASTHSNGSTHTAPAETLYVANAGANVFVNGKAAIVQGGQVLCGELALIGSSTVFIGGKGVHRLGDLCDSHAGSYSPSVCVQASSNVFAN